MSEERIKLNLGIAKGVELDWFKAFQSEIHPTDSVHGLVSTLFCMHPNTKIWVRNSKGEKVKFDGAFKVTEGGIELVAPDDAEREIKIGQKWKHRVSEGVHPDILEIVSQISDTDWGAEVIERMGIKKGEEGFEEYVAVSDFPIKMQEGYLTDFYELIAEREK